MPSGSNRTDSVLTHQTKIASLIGNLNVNWKPGLENMLSCSNDTEIIFLREIGYFIRQISCIQGLFSD